MDASRVQRSVSASIIQTETHHRVRHMQSAPAALEAFDVRQPSRVHACLSKRNAKGNKLFSFMHWGLREFTLENGRMRWVKREHLPGGLPPVLTFRGAIDFAKTKCEVVEMPGSTSKFILRPKDGHVWSERDEHRYTGTAREFVLDATVSRISREIWIFHIREHMAWGRAQTLAAVRRCEAIVQSSFSVVECEELNGDTCSICLEEFVASDVCNERSKVFKAKCGHVFHASCVVTWLRKKHTCPLCREDVLPGVPCTGASDVEQSSAINLPL